MKTNRFGRVRDSQRSKVYAAEKVLGHHTLGTQYTTVDDCYDYLMSVINRKTFQRWFPSTFQALQPHTGMVLNIFGTGRDGIVHVDRGLKIRPGQGARNAFASFDDGETITLPLWARNEPVMLHELCHLIVRHDYRPRYGSGSPKPAAHGWEFCHVYLKVVGNVMGPEARELLKASLKEHRVKFNKPRKKRVYTEDELQILRARMAVARAAKKGYQQ